MKHILTFLVFCITMNHTFAQTELESNYIDDQGLPFSGLYKSYDGQNRLVYTVQVLDGALHGTITYFDIDGRIDQLGQYSMGEKQGKWEQFNDHGALVGQAFYQKGLKHGIWSVWDDNGVKRYHMVYDNGQKVDVWKVYNEQEVLVAERTYSPQ